MYFETWITTDQRKLPETIALHGNVFTQDNMANLIGVVLKNDGANVDIDGSVVGYAIRADKNTVIINGEKEGNRAWVILPEAAYAYPGPLSVVIRVVNGEDKTVIGACSGYVTRSISGSPVDPGHVIPDITELLAMIEECEEAAGDANTAAALANTKAGLADTAATRANNAAAALEDMDATATTLTPGSSATATVSTVDGHYRVALGIPQGAKGDKGDTGDIGPTPAFSIGTVETLEPSEDATATITGTAAAPVLNLGIPKGDAGEVTEAELDAAIATAAPAIIASAGPAEIVSVTDGAEDAPVKSLVVNIEPVQAGSGDPSPDNVRPISGWASVSLYGIGINGADGYLDRNAIDADGSIVASSSFKVSAAIPAGAGQSVIINYNYTGGHRCRVAAYDRNNALLSFLRNITPSTGPKNEVLSATCPENTAYIRMSIPRSATNWIVGIVHTNNLITLPAEAGTVYGGTLTLNSDGSGELVADRAGIASYSGESLPGEWISDRDVYAPGATPTTGAQVVYYLATPVTYSLTAPQLRTLLGANNIWADAGRVSVEYTADTKMYIDSQTRATRSLIAGIETDLTASRPYSAGDLLIVGDTLYKAAASIASGATLTPGTNVTPTTVAEQLILLANA